MQKPARSKGRIPDLPLLRAGFCKVAGLQISQAISKI